jgi:hypothetical protein
MASPTPGPHPNRARSLAFPTYIAGFATVSIFSSAAFGPSKVGLTVTRRCAPACSLFSLALIRSTLGVKVVRPIDRPNRAREGRGTGASSSRAAQGPVSRVRGRSPARDGAGHLGTDDRPKVEKLVEKLLLKI